MVEWVLTSMKKPIIWIVSVLVVLILVGGYFVFLGKATNVVVVDNQPASSSSPVAGTEAWYVYSGSGYNFRYPKDLVESQIGGGVRFTAPIKSYFRTILADEAYITAYAPTSTCPASQGESFQATTTIKTPDGLSVNKVVWSGVGAGQLYQGADYSVVKSGECYEISLYTHGANGAGFYFNDATMIKNTDTTNSEDMANFFALIDTIVTTFKFK